MILLSTKSTVNPIAAQLNIAVIPGDGIGKEVMPEGVRVLEKAGSKHGISFDWQEFDWSCETYLKTGHMMPEDGIEQLSAFDPTVKAIVVSGYSNDPVMSMHEDYGFCGCLGKPFEEADLARVLEEVL